MANRIGRAPSGFIYIREADNRSAVSIEHIVAIKWTKKVSYLEEAHEYLIRIYDSNGVDWTIRYEDMQRSKDAYKWLLKLIELHRYGEEGVIEWFH